MSAFGRATLGTFLVGILLAGFASPASAAVDGPLGTFNESVSIQVPGFRGIEPNLALGYDSSAKNGWAGVGWNLKGVGRIERAAPGRGAPLYNASDIFVLDGVADGDELYPCQVGSVSPSCTSGGTHSTRNESYTKITYSGSGGSSRWTFVDKDGTKRVYAPVYTVSTGPDGTANTNDDVQYKWGISQVIDTKNNVVTYNWSANQLGCCWDLLDSITYNGSTIKFYYEARPDVAQLAIGGTYGMSTIYGRLKTIDVKVGATRVRSYKLGYTTSSATGRSLLSSVQQFGKDATLDASGTVTGGTSFPAIVAGYQGGAPSFAASTSSAAMTYAAGSNYLPMDINGDGKTDLLQLRDTGTEYERNSWISNGAGFTLAATAGGISNEAGTQFFAMDINGDGKSDLLQIEPNASTYGRHVWLSNGSGFTDGADDTAIAFHSGTKFFALDANGDGKTDLVELKPNGLCWKRTTWLSTGSGFAAGPNDCAMRYDSDSKFFPIDMNGDGKTDLLQFSYEVNLFIGTFRRRVWMSTATGFTETNDVVDDDSGQSKLFPVDVNGDGKTDLVRLDRDDGNTSVWLRRVYISTGSSFVLSATDTSLTYDDRSQYFVTDINGDGRDDMVELAYVPRNGKLTPESFSRRVWLSTGSSFTSSGTSDTLPYATDAVFFPMDVNGDGRQDMVQRYRTSSTATTMTIDIGLSAGAQPDLLTSLTTGLGGTTTVSYGASSAWANTNHPGIRHTPIAVTTNDGRGNTATTSYAYAGGLFDWTERRFLGFRYQKEVEPCIAGETSCPYNERWFRQDVNAARELERQDQRAGNGTLLASTVNQYTTNGATLPSTALLTGTWEYTYINTGAACPGADCKRTYTARSYNAYGEVTQEVDYGDYDLTGDETTTSTTYVPNTTAYIVSLPADVKRFQGVGVGGTLLNEVLSYYDGATTWNQAPSAGFETKTAAWLASPSSFVASSKEYDGYGNVTATVDPLGARTSFAFDATYRLFATSTSNALSQTNTAAWDVACGQPTQLTNPNGQVTTLTYDALCRLAVKTGPGGKTEAHTWSGLGSASSQYELVELPAADGTANKLWTRRQFDGFARNWRVAQKGPSAATGDIYVDTTYGARGSVASTTEPYYWVSGQAQPTTYATIYDYDTLDRLRRVTFPGGAYTSKAYGLWSTTETDELGRSKTDRFDADANRIAHDEIVGGATKTTSYVYDARGNLAQSTDPSGNVTTHVTDSLGRKTQMVDPDWGALSYEYDAAGKLTATTDAKAQRTTYGYDALGRKTSKTSKAGTAQATSVSWTYDQARAGFYNVGRLTTTTDAAGSQTVDYDAAGRDVKVVRTIGGTAYTFQRGYDAGDRPLWTTYPDGDTLGTAASPILYDSAGRPKTIPGYVTSAAYNADGGVTQITNANGTVSTRTYSPQRGWINTIATSMGATTIQNVGYTRNAKGLVTTLTSPITNEGWTYTNDELDRLTAATNTSTATYNQTFAYSPIGNITSSSTLGAYTYGTKPHAVTAAGANTYTYDATGHMTSGAGRSLTWNGDNQLASVTAGGVTTTMTYDADGQRIQQVDSVLTRRYFGDDYQVDLPGPTNKYISLGDVLVARKEGATKYWLHTDQLGSIQAETDAAGVAIHRKQYRPYGELLPSSNALEDEPRGYTAQRHDASGLVYLHARYYDPALGRFISPDYIIDGSDTVGLNRYAYVSNRPANATDVGGLGLQAARRVSAAGGNVNVNRPSGLGSVNRGVSATRVVVRQDSSGNRRVTTNNSGSAQTQVRRESNGGRTLTTQYSTHYFAPRPAPVASIGASGAGTYAPSTGSSYSVSVPSASAGVPVTSTGWWSSLPAPASPPTYDLISYMEVNPFVPSPARPTVDCFMCRTRQILGFDTPLGPGDKVGPLSFIGGTGPVGNFISGVKNFVTSIKGEVNVNTDSEIRNVASR